MSTPTGECVATVVDGLLSDDCNCPDCREYWADVAESETEMGR